MHKQKELNVVCTFIYIYIYLYTVCILYLCMYVCMFERSTDPPSLSGGARCCSICLLQILSDFERLEERRIVIRVLEVRNLEAALFIEDGLSLRASSRARSEDVWYFEHIELFTDDFREWRCFIAP